MTPEERQINEHALNHAKTLSDLAETIVDEIEACIEQDKVMTEALYREISKILKMMADNMENFRRSMGH
jgi:hypothetical protein